MKAYTEDGNDSVWDYDINKLVFYSESSHGALFDNLEWGATNDTWTPEPDTAGLMLMGLATMCMRRRRT